MDDSYRRICRLIILEEARREMERKLFKGAVLVVLFAAAVLHGIWLVWAEAGSADEVQETNENVFTLGEVEVVEKEQKNKNVTVEDVTNDEMRLFERNNVADALDLLPGVTTSLTGARNEMTVYVRGFDIKHVPLFQDGIPIYVPYDGYPDLSRFTTFDLSEIILSKGFTSLLYGPNTMGGAINMISRKPSKKFEVDAGAGYGSGDTYNVNGNFGSKWNKGYLQGGALYMTAAIFPCPVISLQLPRKTRDTVTIRISTTVSLTSSSV